MAVRKFILNIGQSNAGARADYVTWATIHPGLYVDYAPLSAPVARGGYTDTLTLPGTWPEYPTVSLKGSAIDAIRYLTFYNPSATGLLYFSYPHTMRITEVLGATTTTTAFRTSLKWQYNPEGQTIVRKRTGTTHTVPAASWGGLIAPPNTQQDSIIVTPAFDPPAEVGEELTYVIRAGANSPATNVVVFDARFGDDFGTNGTWDASLAGLRVRCTNSTHPQNIGEIRYVSGITLDAGIANDVAGAPPTVKMTFSQAWPQHPNDGDTFVIEPPPVGATAVPFEKYAYWLPYCPLEGRVLGLRATPATITASAVVNSGGYAQFTVPSGHGMVLGHLVQVVGQSAYVGYHRVIATGATTVTLAVAYSVALSITTTLTPQGQINPYPPGFNYPNHIDKPLFYQPYIGETYMYGPSAFALSQRAAYHVGLANRIQEKLSETIYVASLTIDGSTITQNELYAGYDVPVGWYDPDQQLSWAAGDDNNIFARLIDTLDAARLAALRDGDTLQCVGVFFIQGEGDSVQSYFAERYADSLRALKTAVRNAIVSAGLYSGAAATIPWVQPHISATSMLAPWPYITAINAAIDLNAQQDTYMRTFSMDDAPKIIDLALAPPIGPETGAHYDAYGITILEQRCFTAWEDVYEALSPAGYSADLAVETGTTTGSATSNSYASLDYAAAYFGTMGGVLTWTSATEQAKAHALMRATEWIDAQYGLRFVGLKASSTQALEWPRSFAVDRHGYDISGVPLALKKATAEIARRYVEDATQFNADTAAGSNILQDQLTVGPITISKTYAGTKDSAKKYPIVDRLFQVAGIIESGGWAQR